MAETAEINEPLTKLDDETMAKLKAKVKPLKPDGRSKKERTPAQIESFKKAQEKRWAEMKALKELQQKEHELERLRRKESRPKKTPKIIYADESETDDEAEEIIIVKKPKPKAAPPKSAPPTPIAPPPPPSAPIPIPDPKKIYNSLFKR